MLKKLIIDFTPAAVVQDVKTILSEEKFKRNDKSREVVSILTASMSGPTVEKCKAKVDLVKKLGVSVRRIPKGQKIRTNIFHSEQSSYRYTTRKTRSDKLSDDARKTIYDFWCSPEISRQTGNQKDVKRIRVCPKMYYSHAIQILEKTQSEAFLNFQQTHPEIQISQRTFEKCKPYFVRAARIKDRTTCCCRYHLECKYLFNSFIAYRKQLIDEVIDETSFKLYGSLTELCNDTLCYQETGNLHAKDCIERSCDQCGVHLIKFSEHELSTCNESPDVKWKKIEYIDIKTKYRTKKKLMLVDKTTKAGDMIKYFIKKKITVFRRS
jgi:hypothetical protein